MFSFTEADISALQEREAGNTPREQPLENSESDALQLFRSCCSATPRARIIAKRLYGALVSTAFSPTTKGSSISIL